jgi:hypothetical protein
MGMVIGALLGFLTILFVPDIEDLRFDNIELVRRESVVVDHRFSPRNLEQFDTYLKLEFSTETDLLDLAERSELNLWIRSDYCPIDESLNGRGEVDAYGPFYGSLPLPLHATDEQKVRYRESTSKLSPNSRRVYTAYLVPRQTEREYLNHTEPRLPAYDLSEAETDVCFLVGGGNMLGGHFLSNPIVIPREVIIRAFETGSE